MAWHGDLDGVRGRGTDARRVTQEPGRSRHLVVKDETVRTSESEAERGWREVGALHRSEDAGEPTRGTLPSKGRRQETEPSERKMAETSNPTSISTKLERIAKLARDAPQMVLTTLAHHIDLEWLHEAYVRTRKDGAKGVDGQSAEQSLRESRQ